MEMSPSSKESVHSAGEWTGGLLALITQKYLFQGNEESNDGEKWKLEGESLSWF